MSLRRRPHRTMPQIDVFSALASPVRRELLFRLRLGPLPVGELCRDVKIGRTAVSMHLRVLRRAELVVEEAKGRQRLYYLDPRHLRQVEDWTQEFHRFWRQRSDAVAFLVRRKARRR